MKYVNLSAAINGIDGVLSPKDYLDRLPELRSTLPPGAAAFAADPGHYDFCSVRCVHDLKLDRILFGEAEDESELTLEFRHNCWKHEEDLTIRYQGLVGFTLRTESDLPQVTRLGEVILDEVLPHPDGCAHEIACHTGSITVVSRDLTATWTKVRDHIC